MTHLDEREGVIKYSCQRTRRQISQSQGMTDIFALREPLFNRKLIGVDKDGLGYGNISCRLYSSPRFLITGSQTSGFEQVSGRQLAEVLVVDIENNFLSFAGEIQASSESMTHAALYQADSDIKGVVHVHSRSIWERYINRLPTTRAHAVYGTPEMAYEVIRLYRSSAVAKQGVIILAGHPDGIIAFGPSLRIAGQLILDLDMS